MAATFSKRKEEWLNSLVWTKLIKTRFYFVILYPKNIHHEHWTMNIHYYEYMYIIYESNLQSLSLIKIINHQNLEIISTKCKYFCETK